MQRRGHESWRMGTDVHPSLAQLALYVRDACRLPVAAAPGIPPPLSGDVLDHRDLLEPSERAGAAARWVRWWEAIVAHEGASQLGVLVLPTDRMARLDTHAALEQRVFDWPELEVLGDEPALQRVVRTLFDEGSRWCSEQARVARTSGGPGGSPIPGGLARAVAEEVIERTGVRAGRVRAGVLVLGVDAHWAHLPSPGVLVCSEATARDEARIRPLLEEAFRSGVDALEVEVPAMTPRRPPRPASVLAGPVAFAGDGELELSLEAVLPYADGFELLLRRRGGGPPPPRAADAARRRQEARPVGKARPVRPLRRPRAGDLLRRRPQRGDRGPRRTRRRWCGHPLQVLARRGRGRAVDLGGAPSACRTRNGARRVARLWPGCSNRQLRGRAASLHVTTEQGSRRAPDVPIWRSRGGMGSGVRRQRSGALSAKNLTSVDKRPGEVDLS